MDFEKLDHLIQKRTHGDADAKQDVWLEILTKGITVEKEIEQLAEKLYQKNRWEGFRRPYSLDKSLSTDDQRNLYDLIPSLPLEPNAFLPRRRFLSPRYVDVSCIYCNSSQILKFGTHNRVQLFWCKVCLHKFRYTSAPFKMRYDKGIMIFALDCIAQGASFSQTLRMVKNNYNVQPASATLSEWKNNPTLRQRILETC